MSDPDPVRAAPPFNPDPELIDHLEGNRRERDRYRAYARSVREVATVTDPDPVRALALTLAVELARSNEPIEFGAGVEVADTVLVVAKVFEGYLRGEP